LIFARPCAGFFYSQSRMKTPQFLLPLAHELVIDLFAGGGGASTGIEAAIGRHVDIAVNHDPEAISLHTANHPQTRHFISDVFEVNPIAVTKGQPVGALWASPDCKHFSKAKGGTPVSKKIRGLAWVVVKWAKAVKPRVIFLENVEEFQTWGPLGEDNRPCPERKGETFKQWVGQLEALGYKVEWRELRACDYGAPTIRKRLFLVARRDGLPIVWPEPTHAKPDAKGKAPKGLKPWRTAAECIDWSIPCPSIFERKKPLADATCRRIAKGLVRYVIEAGKPFIVSIANWSSESVRSTGQPLSTVTANPKGGHHAIVVPTLIQTGYGERPGQSPRVPGLDKPLGTVVNGQKHALVSAFLAKHYTGVVGSDLTDPIGTVTSVDHHSLVTASLIHMGHGEGKNGGKRFSHGVRDIEQPLNTVTASGAAAGLVTSHLVKLRGDNVGGPVTEPLHTISAQGTHHGEVRAFLVKYYSEGGQDQSLNDPAHTIPTKDRLGLVTVTIAGEEWVIVDIGLRMLTPKELYAAQGFPASYQFETGADGEAMTKTAQVRMCGNSVSPPPAEALVRANYSEIAEGRIAA
jgi:DNA (cytosine-5)-methyltransferase 1